MASDRESYERAFVALSYLMGRRASELSSPLPDPSRAALELARHLGRSDRTARASILAAELAKLAQSLERWRLV